VTIKQPTSSPPCARRGLATSEQVETSGSTVHWGNRIGIARLIELDAKTVRRRPVRVRAFAHAAAKQPGRAARKAASR
jgi:hypothetical protein